MQKEHRLRILISEVDETLDKYYRSYKLILEKSLLNLPVITILCPAPQLLKEYRVTTPGEFRLLPWIKVIFEYPAEKSYFQIISTLLNREFEYVYKWTDHEITRFDIIEGLMKEHNMPKKFEGYFMFTRVKYSWQ